MDYEWDPDKAQSNLRKHGVDFADALAALEDPKRLEDVEPELVDGEERVDVIGLAYGTVLFVVTTIRVEDVCRIISARKATRYEQDRYYSSDAESW